MPLKSTQTAASKYDTMCWIQESPESSELSHNGYTVKKSATGQPFCIFEATLQTFDCYNRMGRRYDAHNVCQVIDTDERIQTLLKQNKWRGELNHPNPDIKGQQYSDIRITIPEPLNSSHFISNNRLEGSKYKGTITTHPGTKAGICASSEVIDLGIVPSFSVRLLGNMLPNAPRNQPNIRVTKVITWDMVDFPSHVGADADIEAKFMEAATDVVFLKQLADYCSEESETLSVVCESFQISRDEILGIKDNNVIVEQADSRLWIPLPSDIREEALSILRNRR